MIKLESGRDRDIIDIMGRRSVRHPDPKFVTPGRRSQLTFTMDKQSRALVAAEHSVDEIRKISRRIRTT